MVRKRARIEPTDDFQQILPQTRPQIAQRMVVAKAGGNDAGGRFFPVGRKVLDVACFPSHTSLSGGEAWGWESAGGDAT